MIQLKQLTLLRGAKTLLDEANLTITVKQKIGIIGPNGAGKSSLFMLLKNELREEQGELFMPKGLTMAHIKQEMPEGTQNILDYTLEGDVEYTELQRKLTIAETEEDGMAMAEVHTRLGEIDGYSLPSVAAKILLGLGFSQEELEKEIEGFSGGWRMRLNLAQVLLAKADILLLDEPTNHLDMEAILWLEEWLQKTPQTTLLISHDRDFIDKVITHIVDFRDRKLEMYSGNYSAFERQRAEKIAIQQATYTKQQHAKKHLESFVERFRAKASKAKQAQSRLKMLERMELVEKVHQNSAFHFAFKETESAGNPMLRLEHAEVGYGDKPILKNLNFSISDGDRIGLIGPNGAGKSTLIKLLADELTPLSGENTRSKKIKVGYFAQHQLEQLRPDETALKHLQLFNPKITEREGRQYLGGFNFKGDDVFRPIEGFSGGEKARLVLALLIQQKPNLLLLDEPTNHLDLEVREALTIALQQFTGALILVSHDRYLLKNVIDELWLIADSHVGMFDGTVEDYRTWFNNRVREEQSNTKSKSKKTTTPSTATPAAISKLEKRLEDLQTKLSKIDESLADTKLYEKGQEIALDKLTKRRKRFVSDIARIEEELLGML
jgi:ATP-binding cassette subfamily F protein 3